MAGEDHRLGLRLALAAHRAVGHHPSVGEPGQRRLDGVKRPAPRLQAVVMRRVEREAGAPVLPGDPGLLQHDAGAELPIEALDEADRAALAVDRAQPDGVAARIGIGPGRGTGGVDRGGHPVESVSR